MLALKFLSGGNQNQTNLVNDIEKAAYWFSKAAEQGHAEAQNNLKIAQHHLRVI